MSINTGDALIYAPPAWQCGACFPPGETPATVFVCFSGIIRGPKAGPADPPAPYGIFELPVIAACSWRLSPAPVNGRYFVTDVSTWVQLDDGAGLNFFLKATGIQCSSWFPNGNDTPLLYEYYGGYGVMCSLGDSGPLPLKTVMDEVGIEMEDQTWANPRPKSAGETVFTFSRRSDATNIHVLYKPA